MPMVMANLGIGVAPQLFIRREELGSTVFPIELEEQIPLRGICLLNSTRHPQGSAARELQRFLTQAAALQ